MTEKRFNLISDNNLQLYDFIEDNGKVIHTTKVVDLLNELAEENEQLKKENQAIQDKVFKLLDWLEKEKEVNRNEIKEWWNDY